MVFFKCLDYLILRVKALFMFALFEPCFYFADMLVLYSNAKPSSISVASPKLTGNNQSIYCYIIYVLTKQ